MFPLQPGRIPFSSPEWTEEALAPCGTESGMDSRYNEQRNKVGQGTRQSGGQKARGSWLLGPQSWASAADNGAETP